MKTIDIKGGKKAIVDDEDFLPLSAKKWYCTVGYAVRYIGARETGEKPYFLTMHREIMGLQKGDKRVVDHINGDKLDNRRENLRVCTHSQNLMNRPAKVNNGTGLKGVSLCKATGRWRATINIAGAKCKHLGYFDTPKEAHEAYCNAASEIHGEFARTE